MSVVSSGWWSCRSMRLLTESPTGFCLSTTVFFVSPCPLVPIARVGLHLDQDREGVGGPGSLLHLWGLQD